MPVQERLQAAGACTDCWFDRTSSLPGWTTFKLWPKAHPRGASQADRPASQGPQVLSIWAPLWGQKEGRLSPPPPWGSLAFQIQGCQKCPELPPVGTCGCLGSSIKANAKPDGQTNISPLCLNSFDFACLEHGLIDPQAEYLNVTIV